MPSRLGRNWLIEDLREVYLAASGCMGRCVRLGNVPGFRNEKANKKTEKRRRKDVDEKKAPEGAFSGLLPSGFGR
jgi:hypothetical protein